MQVAVLDGEPLRLARRASAAYLEHPGDVVWVDVIHPEVDDPHSLRPVRGDAEEIAEPVVRVHPSAVEVHLVEAETGQFHSRGQPPSLARSASSRARGR